MSIHVLYQIPELAGQPFRPANATEGNLFCGAFCERCAGEDENHDCPILTDTLVFDADTPEYPSEWTFDPDGWPVCTAFEDCEKAAPPMFLNENGDWECSFCGHRTLIFTESRHKADCPWARAKYGI